MIKILRELEYYLHNDIMSWNIFKYLLNRVNLTLYVKYDNDYRKNKKYEKVIGYSKINNFSLINTEKFGYIDINKCQFRIRHNKSSYNIIR